MATKKQRRVKHLNEVGASVQFRANGLRVSVTVPWEDLERRLGVSLQAARKKQQLENWVEDLLTHPIHSVTDRSLVHLSVEAIIGRR